MTPELVALLDKVTFTGFLMIAVYILHRDSRADITAIILGNASQTDQLIKRLDGLAELLQKVLTRQEKQESETQALEDKNAKREAKSG